MGAKKIEYAVAAASLFIQHLHRENFDRGMVATFGNGFRVEQHFTGCERDLQSTLLRVSRSVTNEGTRLYSSIEDVIMQFWNRDYGAHRNRPWLLTVITDGQDNDHYGKYYGRPGDIGRFIATRFNHEPSNFMFVIGVGEGNQIDKRALAIMGDQGNFPAITIGAFPLLERLFLRIALQVTTEIEGIQIDIGNLTWREVSQIRRVSQVAFDYAFLIDRSGSMSDPG
jgi:hypothetical protein